MQPGSSSARVPSTRVRWGLAVLASVALASADSRADPDAEGPRERVLPVAVRSLERATYAITLPEKVGIIEAAASLTLSFEVSGTLERIMGDGASIEEGGEIAVLDTEHEAAELERAQLLLAEARRELARMRGLRKAQATSKSALDSASTAAQLRRAELDLARERLARRRLQARFSGVVADVRVDPGEVVVPGMAIARLLNFDLMQVEVGVPARQVSSIRPGARVEVVVPALGDEVLEGTVHLVPPSAEENSVLFKVEILIPNPEGRLRPGMSARARIVTREVENALVVPLEASVSRAGRRVVFFVEDEHARAISVDDAWLHGDRLVLDTAAPSQDLVVRGQHDLDDGRRVRVDNAILGDTSDAEPLGGTAHPAASSRP